MPWDVAGHYALAGNGREAIRWLRISFDAHEERLIGLEANPKFQPIRNHPEFKLLFAGIGLPSG